MSCYLFNQKSIEALKKGERLFVPGIDPEEYDCWEIEYTRAPLFGADNYFGLDDPPTNLSVKILAIKGETSEEAANRFRKWCEQVYSSISVRSSVVTILNARYVKAEKMEEL